jgi:hypothetical protein
VDWLYAPPAVAALAATAGLSRPQADEALHKHLGVVFDIRHQAVEFEDIAGTPRTPKLVPKTRHQL